MFVKIIHKECRTKKLTSVLINSCALILYFKSNIWKKGCIKLSLIKSFLPIAHCTLNNTTHLVFLYIN